MKLVFSARLRPHLSVIVFSVSLLILVVAGFFLYQWINRLSRLDRQHEQEDLVAAMVNLERGFSAELVEMASSFRPIPRARAGNSWGPYLFESYSQWRTTTRWPDLVKSISIAIRSSAGNVSFETFDPATGDFTPQTWPPALSRFREALEQEALSPHFRLPFPPRGFASLLVGNHPTLAVPLFNLPPAQEARAVEMETTPPNLAHRHPFTVPRGVAGATPGPGGLPRFHYFRQADFQLTGWCFLDLDPGYLKSQVLPALVQQYFGASGLARYRVAVVTADPPQVIYASDSAAGAAEFSVYDAKVTLFAPRLRFGPFGPNRGMRAREQRLRRRMEVAEGRRMAAPPVPPELHWRERVNNNPRAWQLVARDKRGSLDSEVNAVRRRNLAIAFGTLFLLALSIGTLVIAAHRAAHLAHRQMEFVAGISHELRTPLTVIESAAHNLAQGLVNDPGRVRQYGEAIQTEGRRLSGLIQQTLGYAALQSGRQQYQFKVVSVEEVLGRAWAEFAPAFKEDGWTVQKEISPGIPPVEADPQVLESAIKNLLSNALKYAAQGKWLRVTVRTTHRLRGREVVIAVEDRGPGIDPGDLPHIFEPFYRGRKVVASSTAGAGLGLSLVAEHLEAHQGRVAAQNARPNGARFLLFLPCPG